MSLLNSSFIAAKFKILSSKNRSYSSINSLIILHNFLCFAVSILCEYPTIVDNTIGRRKYFV